MAVSSNTLTLGHRFHHERADVALTDFHTGLIYQVRTEIILIIAVQHLRRHPDSWKDRIQDEQA